MNHIEIGVVVCVMMFFVSIQCDECADRVCDEIPKHYNELGCKISNDNDACCATRFECPDYAKYDPSKCHLRGKQYNVSDMLGTNDAPNHLASCKCTRIDDDEPATFDCAVIECPEDFGDDYCSEDCTPTIEPNHTLSCISTYENVTSICRSKKICDENEMANLPKCYDNNKLYHLGEKFEPSTHSCYECLCTEDFDNTTAVIDNVNCAKIDCAIEIRDAKRIRDGCTPIYYGREGCCPIDFRCPSDNDQIMDSDLKFDDAGSIDGTCIFGNLTLQINQQLDTLDKCVECKCIIPPMITCMQLTDCSSQ